MSSVTYIGKEVIRVLHWTWYSHKSWQAPSVAFIIDGYVTHTSPVPPITSRASFHFQLREHASMSPVGEKSSLTW
jgi:hypothetical protein